MILSKALGRAQSLPLWESKRSMKDNSWLHRSLNLNHLKNFMHLNSLYNLSPSILSHLKITLLKIWIRIELREKILLFNHKIKLKPRCWIALTILAVKAGNNLSKTLKGIATILKSSICKIFHLFKMCKTKLFWVSKISLTKWKLRMDKFRTKCMDLLLILQLISSTLLTRPWCNLKSGRSKIYLKILS